MSLSSDIARRALEVSRTRARELGCQVSIALVDSAGHLVAFERMMAPYAWATGGIATAKATSAVMFNQSTSDISRWAGEIPGFASSMASMTQGKFIMAPGGWPIRGPNGVTVGAIGISGGNAPGRDDEIARAGVHAAEAALHMQYQQRLQAQAQAQAQAVAQAQAMAQQSMMQAAVPVASGVQQSAQAQSEPLAAPLTLDLQRPEPAASQYLSITPEEQAPASAENDQPANSIDLDKP